MSWCTHRDGVRADRGGQTLVGTLEPCRKCIILMLKLSENPPVTSAPAGGIAAFRGRWWVAHTKARFEKAFAWNLLGRGIGYFLPMVERVQISGGKKRRVLMPLFSSYVFFCGSEEDRYAALATNRLCQTIEVAEQEMLIRQLLDLEKAIVAQVPLDPYPFAAVGERCRVTSGPFQGLEGVVVERNKLSRLALEVNVLGQAAVMEIDADLLEPLA